MPVVRAWRSGVPRPMARAVAPLTVALAALVAACAPDRARDEARERARTAAFDRSARRFAELATQVTHARAPKEAWLQCWGPGLIRSPSRPEG